MYFAIRVIVACAIMATYYFTLGFGSSTSTFLMAFSAALAAQAAAFGVKLLVGRQERSQRALALLAGCAVAVVISVVVVAISR